MTIIVRGHNIEAVFVFVCDGKLYRSNTSKSWWNIQDQFGYSVFGRYQYGWRVRNVPCSGNRDHELQMACRSALTRATGLTGSKLDAFIQSHMDKKMQILIQGDSVKVYNKGATVNVAGYSATTTTGEITPPPAESAKQKVKRSAEEILQAQSPVYVKNGVPKGEEAAFHEWYRKRTGKFQRVKLKDVIAAWKTEIASQTQSEEPAAKEVKPPRSLIEEREHKEDVPFYGRRRRNQAQFRADVELNCYGRCVITGASALRCEAAHLIPHARKGGASFKNGLLLRSDLHKLFDLGEMAINPENLIVNFTPAVLAMDADLWQIQGMMIRPTDKPIRGENLQERWELFCAANP